MKSLLLVLLAGLTRPRPILTNLYAPESDVLGPIVTTRKGKVAGVSLLSDEHGTAYDAFLGIPYAAPPIGALRFKAPAPASPWFGVLQATRMSRICHQFLPSYPELLGRFPETWNLRTDVRGLADVLRAAPNILQYLSYIFTLQSEDCLNLNVHVPKAAAQWNGSLPVLVWFHGGGFVLGEGGPSLYGPDHFMEEGLIFVSVTYRLGPLGFLNLGPGSGVSGNAGLKDQTAALRWVRDNIESFGGDPEKVTIFGQSAGGASVNYHLLSPMSAGLFRSAIMLSGSALNTWAFSDRQYEVGRRLGQLLGCPSRDNHELAVCLTDRPITEIKRHYLGVRGNAKDPAYFTTTIPFAPSIEVPDGTEDNFLLEKPADLMLKGRFTKVPILFGVTDAEGGLAFLGFDEAPNATTLQRLENNVLNLVRGDVRSALSISAAKQVGHKIKRFYFGNKPINLATVNNFVRLVADGVIVNDAYNAVRLLAASTNKPIYMYQFSFEGELNTLKKLLFLKRIRGAQHTDDLGYLFSSSVVPTPKVRRDSTEFKIRKRMVQMFADFVKTGNPTPNSSFWPPFDLQRPAYLHIDKKFQPRIWFHQKEDTFWDSIYYSIIGGPLYTKIHTILKNSDWLNFKLLPV